MDCEQKATFMKITDKPQYWNGEEWRMHCIFGSDRWTILGETDKRMDHMLASDAGHGDLQRLE